MKCIILAGGFATRLWPLSENKAKPLLHLRDRPILSHIVEGIPENIPIIISTNAVFEKDFRNWAKHFPERDIRIFIEDSLANESKKGALGAVALVLREFGIDDDLLLIAGDNYFGFRISDFLDSFRNHPLLAAHDIGDRLSARKFGVVVMKNGKVTEFQEKPQEPKSSLVSAGCYLFPQRLIPDILEFARQKKDDLGGIFEYFLEKGTDVDAFSFSQKWFDVGSFEGYLKANLDLIGAAVIQKENVRLSEGNQFSGSVFLGSGVRVDRCIVENSVILENCQLEDCVIRSCVVDAGCRLKGVDLSHKMIRKNSRIEKTPCQIPENP